MNIREQRTLRPDSKWHQIRKIVRKKKVFDVNTPDPGSRWTSVYQRAREGTAGFFGLHGDEEKNGRMQGKWNDRLKQLYGHSGMFALKGMDQMGTVATDIEMKGHGEDVVDGLLPPSRDRKLRPKQNVFKVTYDTVTGDKKSLKNRSYALADINRTRLAEWNMSRPIGQGKFFDEATPTSRVVQRAPIKSRAFRVDLPNGMRVRRYRMPDDLDEVDSAARGTDGIDGKILEELLENNKREMGTGGWIGRHLFQMERDESKMDKESIKSLASTADVLHRPYFTYWVTFVQVVCYIVTVSVYGFAPIGFHETVYKDEVYSSKMYVESVTYIEKDNLWIGARQADLIHLGAKYSPCMRRDSNIEEAIQTDRQKENNTACCIRNDGAGCVQAPFAECSSILSTWHAGKVCGQDPEYCAAPASVGLFKWSDSIVEWPICTETANLTTSLDRKGGPAHMTCQQAGKPCCIGIQGECRVVTREECAFQRGYFHEEANLCSQISCMDKTCGMLPFWDASYPDQFYRLWISLFIHAGIIQLLITIVFQFLYMRDVEKLLGWFRVALIYLMSGVVGSLASAIFVPYHVEAGPSGSQFGILSVLFVELISTWPILRGPCLTLFKLIGVLLLLFIIGLLPMVDNYAHLFGFVYGFLLSFSLMPHVGYSLSDRRLKAIAVVCSFVGSIVILLVLTLLFYIIPIYNCPYCQYFSCIPFTEGFCDSMEVKVRRVAP